MTAETRSLAVAWRLTLALLVTLMSSSAVAGQEATPSATPSGPSAGQTVEATCRTPVQAPVLIHRVEPGYPATLRKQRVQGVVILEGIIGQDGSISDIRIRKSPSESLSNLAAEAFRQWRYKPALCDGKPVRVYNTVTTRFALESGKLEIKPHVASLPDPNPPCNDRVLAEPRIALQPNLSKKSWHGKFAAVEVLVQEDGSVATVRPIDGNDLKLMEVLVATVQKGWTFSPGRCDGKVERQYVALAIDCRPKKQAA